MNGVKRGIPRGPDLSQHRRGTPCLKCTEHESPTNGHVGQNVNACDVNLFRSSFSVHSTNVAMFCNADTAGAFRTVVSGMHEWLGVPCTAYETDCRSGYVSANQRKKFATSSVSARVALGCRVCGRAAVLHVLFSYSVWVTL